MQKNEQKMTEQQFLRILASTVCGVMLCLVGLVSTTWAWYSMDIVCTNNVIQVGVFDAEMVVTQGDVDVQSDSENRYAAGTYLVHIDSRNSNTPGYCVVRVEGENDRQTIQLYPSGHTEGPSGVTFELVLDNAATVEIIPMLGKPTASVLLGQEVPAETTD